MFKNIRVNSVNPGFVLTPMTEHLDTQYWNRVHPLKGMGKPEDIAKAVLFLVSSDSSWVTGTSLVVDGGYDTM